MTILPKKKPLKDKSSVAETSDSEQRSYHSRLHRSSGPSSATDGSRTSVASWLSANSEPWRVSPTTDTAIAPPVSNINHYSVCQKRRRKEPPPLTATTSSCSRVQSPPIVSNVSSPRSPYNSEDEMDSRIWHHLASSDTSEKEAEFEKILKKEKGLILKKMKEDGACMFRAVADQVYGDEDMHSVVRHHCIDYLFKNRDYFQDYVAEDFDHYIKRKRKDGCYGNHVELQALSEMFNRSIEIYRYSTVPINVFQTSYQTDNVPIRLSYHGNVHYNSIVDPYRATIGIGLGLPSYKPGLADVALMKEAYIKSESVYLEQAMLEDKLKATDRDATVDAIEEIVARESYIQYLRDQETLRKSPQWSASASCSSQFSASCSAGSKTSPISRIESLTSPREENQEKTNQDTSSSVGPSHSGREAAKPVFNFFDHLSPELLGFSAEEKEDKALMQAIRESQIEYMDSLSKTSRLPPSTSPH